MRQGIEISRRGTLSGEVTAGQKRVQRGHARKGQRTWTVIQQGRQTIPKSIMKKKMRQVIASSRRGNLSGEVTPGETKMRRRRPYAHWEFPEEQREDLQNRQLHFQRRAIHPVHGKNHRHYTGC